MFIKMNIAVENKSMHVFKDYEIRMLEVKNVSGWGSGWGTRQPLGCLWVGGAVGVHTAGAMAKMGGRGGEGRGEGKGEGRGGERGGER